jgi:para-nitrobenzyl esterase
MSKSNPEDRNKFNRRQALLLPAQVGIGTALAATASASDSTKTAAHQGPGNCSTPRTAVAGTKYGKVRGYIDGGVLTFKGVPYGQNTGGENRWLPAKPPRVWDGQYPALIFPANCPQRPHDWTSVEQVFLQDWDDGYQSEDMLKLNVWTPSLTGKRAVMVYFHGGGFSYGSSYELPSQDGAQMARNHDIVSVTVNHRLNVLGFLDLIEVGGEAYAESVNAGMTDLVASLRWVRDNIANFGGDPDRVMIYGQSGGASKVTTLLGMPSAAGLIHRAAMQSGGGGLPPDAEPSRELTRQFMKELGLGPKDLGALQKMEWARLNGAYNRAAARINPPIKGDLGLGSGWGPNPRVASGPTVDGRVVTMRAFEDGAPEISKNVPMLMGSVSEEANKMASRPTEAQWHAAMAPILGDGKASEVIVAMKKAHPRKSIRTLSYAVGGLLFRNWVTRMAEMKHNQKAAPAFAYYFSWQSPMLEDAGAWHTAELAFCFDNTKRCEQGTGNTREAQRIARQMAGAWANFARTGNPSQPGLPWTAFNPARMPTMVFDSACRMVDDPEGDVRKLLMGQRSVLL